MAKHMKNTSAPKADAPIIIKGQDIKVATGHPQKVCGTGKHLDGRFRRRRTRAAQQRAALSD